MTAINTSYVIFTSYDINGNVSNHSYTLPISKLTFSITDFGDNSDYNQYKVLWEFGDGEYSTDLQPSHHYREPGLYVVSVIVYDFNDIPYKSTYNINVEVVDYIEDHIEVSNIGEEGTLLEIGNIGRSMISGPYELRTYQSHQNYNKNGGQHVLSYSVSYRTPVGVNSEPINDGLIGVDVDVLGDIKTFDNTFYTEKYSYLRKWTGLLQESDGDYLPFRNLTIDSEKVFVKLTFDGTNYTISECAESDEGAIFCGTVGKTLIGFYTDGIDEYSVGGMYYGGMFSIDVYCSIYFRGETLRDSESVLDDQHIPYNSTAPASNSTPLSLIFNIEPYYNIVIPNEDRLYFYPSTNGMNVDYQYPTTHIGFNYTDTSIPIIWHLHSTGYFGGFTAIDQAGFNSLKIIDSISKYGTVSIQGDKGGGFVLLQEGVDYEIELMSDLIDSIDTRFGFIPYKVKFADIDVDYMDVLITSTSAKCSGIAGSNIEFATASMKIYSSSRLPMPIKENENFAPKTFYDLNTFQPSIKTSDKWMNFISHISGQDDGPNGILPRVYERTSNFVSNHTNVNTCNIQSLLSMYEGVDVSETKFDKAKLLTPPNLRRLVDMLSINREVALPITNRYSETFSDISGVARLRAVNGGIHDEKGLNVGNEITDPYNYTFESGVPVILRNRYSDNSYIVNSNLSQVDGVSYYNIPLDSWNGADVGFNDELINLWGIEVSEREVGDVTPTISYIHKFYKFYEYRYIEQGSQLGGIIINADDSNAASSWSDDEGYIERTIAKQLMNGLNIT